MGKTWQSVRDEDLEREYGIAVAPFRPPARETETRKKEPTFRPPDYGDRRPVDPIQHFGCNVSRDV